MSAYPDYLDLGPLDRAAGIVRLPGSKSISNRILLLAALAEGRTQIHDLLASDDVDRMLEALALLGVSNNRKPAGCGGGRRLQRRLSGQAGRLVPGQRRHGVSSVDGRPCDVRRDTTNCPVYRRMHERPIGDLVDALRSLGADIRYLGNEGYPPLEIRPGTPRQCLEGPDTRRRVQPVSHRIADGAAACRQADHHRGGG